MKKTILLFICLLPIFCQAQTYNFAAIAPSGQTLYYHIGPTWLSNDDTNTWEARVVSPGSGGFLEIGMAILNLLGIWLFLVV